MHRDVILLSDLRDLITCCCFNIHQFQQCLHVLYSSTFNYSGVLVVWRIHVLGTVSCIFWCPVDVLKERMQVVLNNSGDHPCTIVILFFDVVDVDVPRSSMKSA